MRLPWFCNKDRRIVIDDALSIIPVEGFFVKNNVNPENQTVKTQYLF